MKHFRHILPTCALVSVFVQPAAATDDTGEIDEVVVTAARRAVVANDISAALSLVERNEVLAQKLTTDALSSSPGVYLQQTTPGQGAAIIRGLKGSAILHLVDGMPLSNAMFRSAPTPFLAYVPTTAVERIETVRGTPASLYGSQAVGGVIQVVTRVPEFDSENVSVNREVSVSLDSAEQLRSMKAVFDVGHKKLAASISGEYLSTGDRQVGGGQRISPSAYTSKAARFVVSGTPSDRHSWLFDLHFLEQPNTPRVDELVAGFGQIEPSSSEFYFSPSGRTFIHARNSSAESLFGLDWQIDAAWQRVDDDRTTRDFEASTRRRESNSSDLFALSITANSSGDVLSWVAGVDFQSDEVRSSRSEEDINTLFATSIASRFPDKSRIDMGALFVNGDLRLSDHHHLSGGLRISDVRIDVPQTSVNEAATIDVRRLSGDLGWLMDLSTTWRLVANAGFGFRAPNISDLGTLGNRPGNRFNIPNTSLGAESVRQFDIGIRRHSPGIEIELMLYALQFDDRITSVLTGAMTPDGRDVVQSVNAQETSIHGVEAGFSWDITGSVSAEAMLNYAWGRESSSGGPTQPADRIPPLSGRLAIEMDLGPKWQLQSWLNASGNQGRLSDRDIRDVRINPDGTAGWASLGVSMDWRPDDVWQLRIAADNLLDNSYRVHGSGIDGPGRNFMVMIRSVW